MAVVNLRDVLERMHEDVVGDEDGHTRTDVEMIVRILEEIIRKVEDLEHHTHTVS